MKHSDDYSISNILTTVSFMLSFTSLFKLTLIELGKPSKSYSLVDTGLEKLGIGASMSLSPSARYLTMPRTMIIVSVSS